MRCFTFTDFDVDGGQVTPDLENGNNGITAQFGVNAPDNITCHSYVILNNAGGERIPTGGFLVLFY